MRFGVTGTAGYFPVGHCCLHGALDGPVHCRRRVNFKGGAFGAAQLVFDTNRVCAVQNAADPRDEFGAVDGWSRR